MKAKNNFSSFLFLNYSTKEIVCFPSVVFRKHVKCLSERAGVTLGLLFNYTSVI